MTAEGVPLIAPEDESKDKPAGREGETDHEVIVPPLEVGVVVVMLRVTPPFKSLCLCFGHGILGAG